MVLEMKSGSVKLEIPVPAQVLEAASTMAEAFSSMQGSTGLSPLSTLVQIPPGSLKSFLAVRVGVHSGCRTSPTVRTRVSS
jgi:hypothetical protein